MSDPLAPYANETPEQAAERARQQEAQRALEAGELNVPASGAPRRPSARGRRDAGAAHRAREAGRQRS